MRKTVDMNNINVIERIHSSYNKFTKAEKKVANYCLSHRHEVPYLSITDLAYACGVGDASVYRFCRSLKLQGYQEFKMRFSLCSEEAAQADPAGKDVPDTVFNTLPEKIRSSHISAIDETFHLLNLAELERIVILLEQAEHVYFFGVGDSLLAAEEARNKFLRITQKVNCITDSHMQAVTASLTTEKDLVFIISYSGATKDNLQTAKIAREKGARVVCITHFQKSPLTAYCDVVLLCGTKESPLDRGSMSEKTGLLFLIDLLYQCYYERNQGEAERNSELSAASVLDRSL